MSAFQVGFLVTTHTQMFLSIFIFKCLFKKYLKNSCWPKRAQQLELLVAFDLRTCFKGKIVKYMSGINSRWRLQSKEREHKKQSNKFCSRKTEFSINCFFLLLLNWIGWFLDGIRRRKYYTESLLCNTLFTFHFKRFGFASSWIKYSLEFLIKIRLFPLVFFFPLTLTILVGQNFRKW